MLAFTACLPVVGQLHVHVIHERRAMLCTQAVLLDVDTVHVLLMKATMKGLLSFIFI